jgi:hypothetical protein
VYNLHLYIKLKSNFAHFLGSFTCKICYLKQNIDYFYTLFLLGDYKLFYLKHVSMLRILNRMQEEGISDSIRCTYSAVTGTVLCDSCGQAAEMRRTAFVLQ